MKSIQGIKKEMGTVFKENGDVMPFTKVFVPIWPDFEVILGNKVKITGNSKGRGFTGVMKRWGHKGGPATHGQSDRQRSIGSTGPSTPGRVFKGLKMPGRLGGKQITITDSKILEVVKEENFLKVLGGVPGALKSKVTLKFYES